MTTDLHTRGGRETETSCRADPQREARRKAIAVEMDAVTAQWAMSRPAPPAPAEARSPSTVTIYFVGPEGGPIKIGHAARLDFRMKDLRTMNAYPLIIHATVEGPMRLEREYHRRFAAHRLHGEWFSPHEDILAEIAHLSPTAMGVEA